MTADPALRAAAETSKAWPFEEARKLVARVKRTGKTEVLFETGYGPSGLPHIGTFGEVARTTMVRRAFELLCDVPTRLLCFSDDMDGMRKIPETVPDPAALKPYLHMPLTSVPDPFGGDYASFGDHNNAMLRRFLDTFGFQYEFASATDYYKSGKFDQMLLRALEKFDDIMAVMLPTLGEERQATYSPFLPISPISGRVLYVPMKKVDAKAGTITFTDEDGTDVTMLVTGGNTKLQWKPDFGMRWAALGVDFEMFGKDHQTNAPIYDRICEILGAEAPEHYVYELFLDDKGQKISVWHIHQGNPPPPEEGGISFSLLLNLAAVANAHDKSALWGFIRRYQPTLSPETHPRLDLLVKHALRYFDDFVKPKKQYRPPTEDEAKALSDLADALGTLPEHAAPEEIQQKVYDVGRRDPYRTTQKDGSVGVAQSWFNMLYQVLLGEEKGPRFGSFVALYGIDNTRKLIARAVKGELAA
jgi:lysyl-tRNA synthetase class I